MIGFKYDLADGFSEGRAAVKKGKKWGYIDINGNEVVEFKYDEAWRFTEGRAAVKKGKKWGYIDKDGNGIGE